MTMRGIMMALVLLAAAGAAAAQDKNSREAPRATTQLPPALDAGAFDALTRGRIMGHFLGGSWYGAEEYLPGRRVIWADDEGCMRGTWQERNGLICFDYSDGLPERCWHYTQDGTGITAIYNGDPTEPPVALRDQPPPLLCPDEAPNA